MKKVFLSFILVFSFFSLFAIPGVTDIIPTESGQYVYYRDYSFTTETYIGFLQYDNATYAIRYYAPNPEIGSSEIELLITIDPNQDYVLMTGEKIVSSVTMDDNTTINYLHDLFYEFASRRKKTSFPIASSTNLEKLKQIANTLQNSKIQKSEDFFQYGGTVTIEYDFTIPIFNLRSIRSGNETLLQAVTMGQLATNQDTSFNVFQGFPSMPTEKINTSLTQNNMDSLWIENESNFWFIEDDALLYSYEIEITQDFFSGHSYSIFDFLSKELSLSATPSYVYLPEQSIYTDKNSLIVSNIIYLPQTQSFTKDTKVVNPPLQSVEENLLYNLTSVSAFYEYYVANESYFSEKIESYIQ